MGCVPRPLCGGAELDLFFVGGLVQPTSPKENTVWAKTATPIGNVFLQAEEPTTPAAGDVWISNQTASSDDNTLQVCENPYLQIMIGTVKQYVSGAWTIPDVSIYKGGAWHDEVLYLYSYGTYSSYGEFDYSNGYFRSAVETQIDGETCLEITGNGDTGHTSLLSLSTPIGVAKYNTLSITAKSRNANFTSKGGIASNYDKYTASDIAWLTSFNFTGTKTMFTADISALSGQAYAKLINSTGAVISNGLYLYEFALMV